MSLEAMIEALTKAVVENTEALKATGSAAPAATDAEKPAAKKTTARKPAAKKTTARKPAAKKVKEVKLRPEIDVPGLRKLAGSYMETDDTEAREAAKSNIKAAFDHLGIKVLPDIEEQAQMTSLAAYIDTWMANGGDKIDFEAIDERVAEFLEANSADDEEESLLG